MIRRALKEGLRFELAPGEVASLARLSGLAIPLGLACAGVAWGFERLIGFFTTAFFHQRLGFEPGAPAEGGPRWIFLIAPALGGLGVGLLAKWGSDKLKGDGIPEVLEAILTRESRIPLRVALLKPVASALSIGSGGPFGAEGPIIQTGGAVGSLLGQLVPTSPAERRILLAAGAAAGMAATFATPVAAIILAIELLLFEFRTRSFIPCVLAAATATALRFRVMGDAPMFAGMLAPHEPTLGELPTYLVLGLAAGLLTVILSNGLFSAERHFERLRVPGWLKPALGGFAVGVIACFQPRVLGTGYGEIRGELLGAFAAGTLAILLVAKLAAWWAALGAGMAGGVLAPTLMIGGALGALCAQLTGHAGTAAGLFALAGATAVFGASTRATFAAIVFGIEVTRSFDGVLPLMVACVAADAVAILLMRHSILTLKLAHKGLAVEHAMAPDPLAHVPVRAVMSAPAFAVSADERVWALLDRLGTATTHQGFPVLDGANRLAGVVTRGDLLDPSLPLETTVGEVASRPAIQCRPDEPVRIAVERLLEHGVGRLPVVDKNGKVVGILTRSDCLRARLLRAGEEKRPGDG